MWATEISMGSNEVSLGANIVCSGLELELDCSPRWAWSAERWPEETTLPIRVFTSLQSHWSFGLIRRGKIILLLLSFSGVSRLTFLILIYCDLSLSSLTSFFPQLSSLFFSSKLWESYLQDLVFLWVRSHFSLIEQLPQVTSKEESLQSLPPAQYPIRENRDNTGVSSVLNLFYRV